MGVHVVGNYFPFATYIINGYYITTAGLHCACGGSRVWNSLRVEDAVCLSRWVLCVFMRARDNTLWVMRIVHLDPIDTIRTHERHIMTTSNSGTHWHVLHNRSL